MADIERLGWDDYFLRLCETAALRSIDKETQNGAVVANQYRRVVSTGYNAFPQGIDDSFWPRDRDTKVLIPWVSVARPLDLDKKPVAASRLGSAWDREHESYAIDKYFAMTHAEMNAVVAAGQDLHGAVLYTLLFPCHECAKAIITAGIKRVFYLVTRENISWAASKELLVQAHVDLVGPPLPPSEECTEESPCCERRGQYNGFASGPPQFSCPKHCACHD